VSTARPRGIHQHVVDLLGSRIVGGVLQPGETLDLPALEAELGISHTVLRESLRVLGTKGLVDARTKRGTIVTDPASWHMLDREILQWRAGSKDSSRLFAELAEVRLIIEPAAASLAATRASPEDIAGLEAALEHMRKVVNDPDSVAAAAEADVAFHAALLRATHNDLVASLHGVIEQGLRERDLIVHAEPDAENPVPAHRAVVDAIATRDPDVAAGAMRSLLEDAAEHFEALTAQRSRTRRRRGRNT
jgi:DNA-binding FadR family transcriptional regulator